MNIQVKRNTLSTIQLPLAAAIYTDILMGDHSLVFTLTSVQELDVQIGDTLFYKGQLMTINQEPEVTRSHKLDYVIRFEGQRYTLSRFLIKDEGALTFDYMSDLNDYMFMFLESINASDSGWTIGTLEAVEPFALNFDQVDHLAALTMITEGAGCEWSIIGKEISIKKTVGVAHNYPLAYGKDNGLYNIRRVSVGNSKIVTRAYAVGGSQNLPTSYAYKKLTLAGYLDDLAAQAIYGIREGVIEVPEIFPQRTSTATAVGQMNESTFTLTDNLIDFDLNSTRIDGTEAYIVFKSGMLNGQQFKILSYNHTTKMIRYEANKDANGNLIPFGVTVAEIGDSYTLIGIRMPASYVAAALSGLEAKRLEYLNSNKVPRVVYEATLDPLDLKRNGMNIQAGDVLPFTDTKIGLDDNLRVTSVRYSATFPEFLFNGMTYEIEVGNEVTYNRIQKIEKDIKETKDVVTQSTKQSWENDRRNITALNEFKGKVFDPDGNLEEALIQAIVGFFGTESMLFDLDPAPNITMSGDSFAISATNLVHKKFEIAGIGYIWDLTSLNATILDPMKSYYLSAKCSRTALTGEWVLSENKIGTEDVAGDWHFNLGVLSSVIEGSRSFQSTKGYTLISGGTIETDVITAYLINVQKLFAQIITVGSNGYVNAGISGLDDEDELSQRFWAGEDEANRYNAPFQVLDDGSMIAKKGSIGGFNIKNDSLQIGTDDSWEAGDSSVLLTPSYFLLRDNGVTRGKRRELAWNLYKDVLGRPRASAASVFNTIDTASGIALFPYTNVGLEIEANGGDVNLAIDVISGISKFMSLASSFRVLGAGNWYGTESDSYIVLYNGGYYYLPNEANGRVNGRTIIVKSVSSNPQSAILGNGVNIKHSSTVIVNARGLADGNKETYIFSQTDNQWYAL